MMPPLGANLHLQQQEREREKRDGIHTYVHMYNIGSPLPTLGAARAASGPPAPPDPTASQSPSEAKPAAPVLSSEWRVTAPPFPPAGPPFPPPRDIERALAFLAVAGEVALVVVVAVGVDDRNDAALMVVEEEGPNA